MNFKPLRRSDELENVVVFKQSDSYADGSERAGGACPRHRHTALKNAFSDKWNGREALLLRCAHQPNIHSQCI